MDLSGQIKIIRKLPNYQIKKKIRTNSTFDFSLYQKSFLKELQSFQIPQFENHKRAERYLEGHGKTGRSWKRLNRDRRPKRTLCYSPHILIKFIVIY